MKNPFGVQSQKGKIQLLWKSLEPQDRNTTSDEPDWGSSSTVIPNGIYSTACVFINLET